MKSKQGMIESLNEKNKAQVRGIEALIDNDIEKQFECDGTIVHVKLTTIPPPRVRDEIKRMYREGGWNIEFEDNQMEGLQFILS